MKITTARNFTVVEGGLSVNEILRKSRQAVARRKRIKKISIISFILVLIAVFSNIVHAGDEHAADNSVKGYTYITVSRNDTLWSIACEYSDEHYSSIYQYIREVMTLNGLTGDSIYAGSKLMIPVYTAPDYL